jgi:hypothetical protein
MPLLNIARAQPPPCYRAWTTLTRNMTAEDNLVMLLMRMRLGFRV